MKLARIATVFYAGVALAAWGYAAIFDLPLWGDEPATFEGCGWGVTLGIGIVFFSHLSYRLSRRAREATRAMARLLGPVTPAVAVWLAILSGLAEELCFRGALWPHLGLAGTSILFALCHVIPVRGLAVYPFFAFFAGVLLGILRDRTGSVWPPIVAHMTVNALNIMWLGGMERRLQPAPRAPAPPPIPGEPPLLPPDAPLDAEFPITIWRYDLRVELTGTDRETLPDCLQHEELGLYQYVSPEVVARELSEGLFVFARSLAGPLRSFGNDIAAISTYLFQPVSGLEVAERHVDDSTTDDVRAWKIVGLRGEWVKVPLVIAPPEDGRFVVDPDTEDLEVLAAHWEEYPRWFQDGMRFKYPQLRDL